ncbi:hypothetical protein KM043_003275 [Ampulex compressa]|nr:hypothetical protein KM043_003275 [Ampulex compressa]
MSEAEVVLLVTVVRRSWSILACEDNSRSVSRGRKIQADLRDERLPRRNSRDTSERFRRRIRLEDSRGAVAREMFPRPDNRSHEITEPRPGSESSKADPRLRASPKGSIALLSIETSPGWTNALYSRRPRLIKSAVLEARAGKQREILGSVNLFSSREGGPPSADRDREGAGERGKSLTSPIVRHAPMSAHVASKPRNIPPRSGRAIRRTKKGWRAAAPLCPGRPSNRGWSALVRK